MASEWALLCGRLYLLLVQMVERLVARCCLQLKHHKHNILRPVDVAVQCCRRRTSLLPRPPTHPPTLTHTLTLYRGDAALVAAAVRHVAAQTQLDLSGAAFKRFIEVHYTVSDCKCALSRRFWKGGTLSGGELGRVEG